MILQSSSSAAPSRDRRWPRWMVVPLLPVWTYGAFWLAQLVMGVAAQLILLCGVPEAALMSVAGTTVWSTLVYGATIAIAVGLPWLLWRRRTTRQEMGVGDRPAWLDVALAPMVFVLYFITSAYVMVVAKSWLPIDVNQEQALPFDRMALMGSWEYVLVFIALAVVAPIAEELLFRGYLYHRLRSSAPVWLSVLLTSLVFGLAHAWAGHDRPLHWVVVIDTATLSIFLCLLREYTGAVWSSILVHMIKNSIAFYFLFLNPQLITYVAAVYMP